MSDWDDARAVRDFNKNKPNDAPGLGDDGWNMDSSSSVTSESSFSGGSDLNVNSLLDNALGGSQNTNNNTNNTNYNNSLSGMGCSADDKLKAMSAGEDEIIKTVVSVSKGLVSVGSKSAKGTIDYIKLFVESFQNNKEGDWHVLGERMFKISSVCVGVGTIFCILGFFVPNIQQPSDLVIGGLLGYLFALPLMTFYSKNGEYAHQSTVNEEKEQEDISPGSEENYEWGDDEDNNLLDISEDLNDDWGDEGDNLSSEQDEDLYSWEDEEPLIETEYINSTPVDIDEAISNIPEITPGTQTRQFLFERYMSVLPRITPDYATMYEVTDGSDEFMMFADYLERSSAQAGTKEDNFPFLESVRKNDFIIQLRANRPPGLKEQEIANGVADLYARDDFGKVIHDGVYATVDSMVGALIINIFLGKSIMVSLADVYSNIKDFVIDTRNRFPFVWGINELGDVWNCDLLDCDSLMISGEGRGGKSWKGQSILAQLCMFTSPKEIEFYILDHKNDSSDFKYMSTVLPHIRYFCGDPKKIIPSIKSIIEYCEKTKGEVLKNSGEINIKDYNKHNPDKRLPYTYIVIDELMSLMEVYLDNDEQKELKGYLATVVSKLAYLGVRMILFPHRVVDSVIGKNTYSLISSRAMVRQLNKDEIKNALQVTPKEFPYSLVNEGDMALRSKEIANGKCVFCHAEVLSKDNETNKDIFKYIGSLWKKLEPDCQECIKIDGKIGGRIGDAVKTRNKSSVPIDHTSGIDSYNYVGDLNMGNESEEEDSTEEDFWNELLEEE